MDLDLDALIEDAADARVRLFKAHCEHANEPKTACLALASQLMFQAEQVLVEVYGDPELAKEHIRRTAAGL